MAYTMGFNLFLTAAESFKELYSGTEHTVYFQYLLFGLKGHNDLVPFAWASILCGLLAFILFMVPKFRTNWIWLNAGCVLAYASVYIEKGMGLIVPGFVPSTLHEVVEYLPGKEGLVHISELAPQRVEKVEDVVAMGDELEVKCIGVDPQGKIKLSRKALLQPA